ncbi:hypothetical protein LEP1GSC137_1372 [Leptospira borgpetersenii str. Noumea 25]|nr:hypothetical protein LEP1GSC066_0058 [Leptospira sp. serovar Kenya str. Sh9]EMK13689.1 hypothetical protein LEP1GSC066_4218 [Leptospira sp. serovar Kenya str. Sh9]EMK14823.1 hypothetical protein LEP1GSC066_0933 [Leptospira sp. serovar Kenya str. Sh9]EMO11333.1 hypothetical protein LEP1GSC137_1372 [Leptospira borgpetersenii str. Noumea 25]
MKVRCVKLNHSFNKYDHSKKGVSIFQFVISILKEYKFHPFN